MNHFFVTSRVLSSVLLLGIFAGPKVAFAQSTDVENRGGMWITANATKKVTKAVRVSLTPELRTDGWSPDRGLISFGVRYKPIDYLSLGAGYRTGFGDDKGSLVPERRVNLDLGVEYPLGRFEPSLRIRYTDSYGPSMESEHRFRYKAELDYSLRKPKLSFSSYGEVFHELNDGEVSKLRYGIGTEWTFSKSKRLAQSVELGYHLDYFLTKYRNVHIAEFGYGVTF